MHPYTIHPSSSMSWYKRMSWGDSTANCKTASPWHYSISNTNSVSFRNSPSIYCISILNSWSVQNNTRTIFKITASYETFRIAIPILYRADDSPLAKIAVLILYIQCNLCKPEPGGTARIFLNRFPPRRKFVKAGKFRLDIFPYFFYFSPFKNFFVRHFYEKEGKKRMEGERAKTTYWRLTW